VIDGKELIGDVEIHLSPEDWYHHQHHDDERYNQVILHVSFWKGRKEHAIILENGQSVAHASLESCLTVPQVRLMQLIDLDLYPYRKFVGSGKCAHTLFRKISSKDAAELFQQAALWRLRFKREYLKAHCHNTCEYFEKGTALALGFKHNKEAFLQLHALLLPFREIDEQSLISIAMGLCGLFGNACYEKWKDSEYFCYLKTHYFFLSFSHEIAPRVALHCHQVRPYNHPVRRIIYLIKMMKDTNFKYALPALEDYWRLNCGSGSFSKRDFLALIPDYKDDYWNSHFLFENERRMEHVSLMGEQLKNEILINVFLPHLFWQIENRGEQEELDLFNEFYASFAGANTGKIRYLTHRFFGDTPTGELLKRGDLEQGAYQLHKDFCVHYEASCEGCPFVDRFKTISGK
jgi:hypothetical protein